MVHPADCWQRRFCVVFPTRTSLARRARAGAWTSTVNFAFFDSLTTAEAEDYLRRFLAEASRGCEELARQAEAAGLTTDYSVQSIAPFMLWVLPQLQTAPVAEDSSVPAWIRQTREYRDGLYEFTESSRVTVLRSAFYLGESFVRSFPQLRWGVGDADCAEKHMPAVVGFQHDLELAPIMVAENLYRRVICDRSTSQSIATAVEYWRRNVEQDARPNDDSAFAPSS